MALHESRGLAYSRSSSDLKSAHDAARHGNGEAVSLMPPPKSQRPGMGKGLRRRSTMEWIGASPLTRQKKLEDIIEMRMADTFFSLHANNENDPVYVSEEVPKAMNPNFRFFDLDSCGPGITRLDRLTVKVWARNGSTKGWQYLIELTVHLRALQFIGKTLESFRHPLPQNCILFHMTDGIYTSFTDLPVEEWMRSDILAPPKEQPDGRVLKSSTYDSLMRLSTLDDCIQDALATRDRLAGEIETLIEENKQAIATVEKVPEAQESLKIVESAVVAEKRRVEAVRRRRDELKASIQERKQLMDAGQKLQEQISKEIEEQKEAQQETKELVEKTQDELMGQRRRICEDMQKIYPIEPVRGQSLLFTIRGLALPNAVFDDVKEDDTSAALGFVAHVVTLLSPYLSIMLPYPIYVNGSTSTIDDVLAMNENSQNVPRSYPLFIKGVVRYRFEYGVFLLNKNIEILSNALGLRPVDIRHTLPNLKYLLYVATAGKGELPARKSGGIRGLLKINGGLSRTGSIDSTATASSAGVSEVKDQLNDTRKTDAVHSNGIPVYAKSPSIKQKASALPGSRLREVL
jgi:hypothetical protein